MTGAELARDTAMTDLLALEAAGGLSPVHLDLGGREVTWTTYVGLLSLLGQIKRRTSWWIGDLLVEGESRFGEDVAQAAEALGFAPSTLVNYRWVCSRVAPQRRRAELSFGVHDAVAALGPREQRSWLGRAAREGWTRDRLRAALRDSGVVTVRGRVALGEAQETATRRLTEAYRAVLGSARELDGGWWVPADAWQRFAEVAA